MTLSLLRRSHTPEGADLLFGQAEQILDGASALARSLATELSPPVLSAPRLETILHWIAEKHRSRFGLPVHVEVVGDPELQDHHLRVMLYTPSGSFFSTSSSTRTPERSGSARGRAEGAWRSASKTTAPGSTWRL